MLWEGRRKAEPRPGGRMPKTAKCRDEIHNYVSTQNQIKLQQNFKPNLSVLVQVSDLHCSHFNHPSSLLQLFIKMTTTRTRESHEKLESWKTNNILPEIAQAQIRRLLEEAIQDMDDLNREISEVQYLLDAQHQLTDLQHRKTKDTARIHTLRGTISSLKKIPPEILTEIFIYLSPEMIELPPEKNSCPWILAHVCAPWRDIVWTSHTIWSDIGIDRFMRHGDHWKLLAARRWNKSARASFLHILSTTHALLSCSVSSDGTDGAPPVLDVILSHNHRFDNLTLELNQDDVRSLMNPSQHPWKNLKRLEIVFYGADTPSHNILSSFETAPNLREVFFSSGSQRYSAPPLLLPWEQLTVISVMHVDVPPTVIYTALRQCPAILDCSFTIGTHPNSIPLSDTLLALPSLEILFLESCSTMDWDGFLQPFVTPALKGLTIRAPQAPLQALTSMIVRSPCSLNAMTFTTCTEPPGESEYKSFLGHLAMVTRFNANWITPTSIVKKICTTLLPGLQSSSWTVFPDGLEVLLDFVDTYSSVDLQDSQRWHLGMYIHCLGGPGFAEVEKRYRESHERYRRYVWLELEVFNEGTGYYLQSTGDSEAEEGDSDDDDGSDGAEEEQ